MEDEKKKKRNKKKKNKQAKMTEDVAVGTDENQVTNGHDNHSQASKTAEIRNDPPDLNRHQSNGTEGAILADAEKHHLLHCEAILKETVKQLTNEKDAHMQREATFEETIKQLRKENDLHIKQVAALEESVKQLRNEIGTHIEKEATLEGSVNQLRNENESHMRKQAALEMNILELRREEDVWLQKEVQLQEKINTLLDESATLNSRGASFGEKTKLLEKEKDYWIQMENESKERIAKLNDELTGLRMQVVGLEEARSNLIQENRQLMDNVSSLQLRLQNLETSSSAAPAPSSDELMKHASEKEALNSEIEAARILVEKLFTENAELVEKVNELFVALERQRVAAGPSSTIGNDMVVRSAEITESLTESNQNVSALSHKLETSDGVAVHEEGIGVNGHAGPAALMTNSLEADEPDEPDEIVQIPLDDNEVHDLESQDVDINAKDAVPLTDAPLIGAPFRLISFVAKYVSGADLVNGESS